MASRVTITRDSLTAIVGAIQGIARKRVLIGIPESTTSREDEEESPITNAAIGYIQEFGSPDANIPARPFLIPGVNKARESAREELRSAVTAALEGNKGSIEQHLNAAGVVALNSARNELQTGDFVPLKPSTIRSRKYERGTSSRRPSEERYLALVAGGMSPESAQGATGIRPLINTGALRNSLTYVIRKK